MENPIALRVAVQDAEATAEELRLIVGTLAAELDRQAAEVVAVAEPGELTPDWVGKGEGSSSILDIKVDMGVLKDVAGWLYDRLVGSPTKVKLKYGEFEFEFEGRDASDRAVAMQNFETFLGFIQEQEAAKQAQHG